ASRAEVREDEVRQTFKKLNELKPIKEEVQTLEKIKEKKEKLENKIAKFEERRKAFQIKSIKKEDGFNSQKEKESLDEIIAIQKKIETRIDDTLDFGDYAEAFKKLFLPTKSFFSSAVSESAEVTKFLDDLAGAIAALGGSDDQKKLQLRQKAREI